MQASTVVIIHRHLLDPAGPEAVPPARGDCLCNPWLVKPAWVKLCGSGFALNALRIR